MQYLAAWEPPEDIGAGFPNLKLPFSTGAGIDQFDLAALPCELPVVRMTQPATAARVVLANLRRFKRGETLVGLIDLERGY